MSKKTRNDIIFVLCILVVLAISIAVMIITRTSGDTVIINIDGKKVHEFPLNENLTFSIKSQNGYNDHIIEDGVAYIANASCPDGICKDHRPISGEGESIICLPNKVVVEVKTTKDNGTDIIA